MATFKTKVATGIASAALISGALSYLEPPADDADDRARQQQERRMNDLSDSQDRETDRYRNEGHDLVDGLNDDRNRPGELRPPERGIRLRVVP